MTDYPDITEPYMVGLINLVEGWLTPAEGMLLAKYAKDEKVLEIGSFKGRSACAMGPWALEIHCVDHFHPDAMGQNETPVEESSLPRFLENTKAWRDKIKVWTVSCDTALTMDFPEVGLLFVDANHSYASVKRDMGFMRHVRVGGHVAFHDATFGDVKRALSEMPEGWKFVKRAEAVDVYERLS